MRGGSQSALIGKESYMRGHRVAVVGSVAIDRIEQRGRSVVKLGGVATYAALVFRKHGWPTAVITNVATRHASLLGILREHQISVFNGFTENTTMFVNHVAGSDRWQELPSCSAPITADQARGALDHVDHIHLGPVHPTDISVDLLRFIAEKNVPVSLDVQGVVRRVECGKVRLSVSEYLGEALRCSSVIKAERRELDTILNSYDMDVESLASNFGLSEVVITAGSEGGCIAAASGEVVSYPAKRVEVVVDPTASPLAKSDPPVLTKSEPLSDPESEMEFET